MGTLIDVLVLLLIAAASVALLPSPFGWIIAGIAIIAAIAAATGKLRPHDRR
jgi:hypothetical protein